MLVTPPPAGSRRRGRCGLGQSTPGASLRSEEADATHVPRTTHRPWAWLGLLSPSGAQVLSGMGRWLITGRDGRPRRAPVQSSQGSRPASSCRRLRQSASWCRGRSRTLAGLQSARSPHSDPRERRGRRSSRCAGPSCRRRCGIGSWGVPGGAVSENGCLCQREEGHRGVRVKRIAGRRRPARS